mgnify:CR=1 FL=1
MKRLNKEEVKNYQLGILDTVTEFCEKNQIQYWLDCGTLLGSIRHKAIFHGMMILTLGCYARILIDLCTNLIKKTIATNLLVMN